MLERVLDGAYRKYGYLGINKGVISKTSPGVNGSKLQFFAVGTEVRIVRGIPFSIFPKTPSALIEFFVADSYRE
jgi:hypothetical protein